MNIKKKIEVGKVIASNKSKQIREKYENVGKTNKAIHLYDLIKLKIRDQLKETKTKMCLR